MALWVGALLRPAPAHLACSVRVFHGLCDFATLRKMDKDLRRNGFLACCLKLGARGHTVGKVVMGILDWQHWREIQRGA